SFIVKVPVRVLVPLVMALSILGSYAITTNLAAPLTFLVFAIIGWLMRRYGYPVAAAVVGLLLGSMTEGAMIRTLQISGSDPSYLLQRPIAMVFFALLIASLVWPFLKKHWLKAIARAKAT